MIDTIEFWFFKLGLYGILMIGNLVLLYGLLDLIRSATKVTLHTISWIGKKAFNLGKK